MSDTAAEGPPRRAVLGLLTLAAAAPAGLAASQAPPEVWPLWPKGPPGGGHATAPEKIEEHGTAEHPSRVVSGVDQPHLALVRPARPNGAALIVIPGGSYLGEWFDKEGFDIARRFAEVGVTGFVLRYRLPGEGWRPREDTPLQDAQRAVRLVRARASSLGLDPRRVGVMGFSAGGHLAASVATERTAAYPSTDAADVGDPRPNLSALLYPVIDMAPPFAHQGSADALLGASPSAEAVARRSPHRHVDATTPPTFLAHAFDDTVVPIENSLGYLAALRAAKVPAEAHLFQEGGHGFALTEPPGKPAAAWPELFVAWARRGGFLG